MRPSVEWMKARIDRDERSSTGFVWGTRPRSDFKTETDWRAWNTNNAGRRAGSFRHDGRPPHVGIKTNGKPVHIDLRSLDIAFKTGTWPTRKEMRRLPPWEPSAIPPRQGDVERLTTPKDHVGPGALAEFFADQSEESGYPADRLTVLSKERDPFRLDTPGRRRDAEWFAERFERYFADREECHLREIHYVLATTVPPILRPDGLPYRNEYEDWRWLLHKPAKAARWFGLVPWERIVDNRNDDPVIHRVLRVGKARAASLAVELPVPDEIDATPEPRLEEFGADQPFALALFAEKSSMAEDFDVLTTRYCANGYVGGGDQVDRRVWEIARDAHDDGRKLILFCVCDCDPGGWNMPIVIARKLQAHAVSEFPGLQFEVVRAGLTPEHVRALDLPSSPLKPTEARADRWREAMGIEQTEIDAALALRHDEFIAIIEEAILLYFDETLVRRIGEAEREWEEEVTDAIADQIDDDDIAELQERYDGAREEIEAVNERLNEIANVIELPAPPASPEPEMDGKAERRKPLIDSDWGFVEGSLRLVASKVFGEVVDEEEEEEEEE
jgi:hypothetical protein